MPGEEILYSKIAVQIMEQVIQPATARIIEGEEYYRMESEIVDIISKCVKSK